MRVGDEQSFVEFASVARAAADSPRPDEFSCSVIASSKTFRGEIPSVWFSRGNLDDFLKQLQQLETTRHGSAVLSNLSSLSQYNPLIFEIFSVDYSGHLAVRVELLKFSYDWEEQEPLQVAISFSLDGERFGAVVEGFRNLFGSRAA